MKPEVETWSWNRSWNLDLHYKFKDSKLFNTSSARIQAPSAILTLNYNSNLDSTYVKTRIAGVSMSDHTCDNMKGQATNKEWAFNAKSKGHLRLTRLVGEIEWGWVRPVSLAPRIECWINNIFCCRSAHWCQEIMPKTRGLLSKNRLYHLNVNLEFGIECKSCTMSRQDESHVVLKGILSDNQSRNFGKNCHKCLPSGNLEGLHPNSVETNLNKVCFQLLTREALWGHYQQNPWQRER